MIQHNWSAVLIVYEFVSFTQFNVPFAFVNTLKCTQGTIHIHTLEAHVAIIIAERLSVRQLIVQHSQFAFVYMYICHTLIAWVRFLWSRPMAIRYWSEQEVI